MKKKTACFLFITVMLFAICEHSSIGLTSTLSASKGNAPEDTWKMVYRSQGGAWGNIFFANENSGWAVGSSGQIIHSLDSGNTWSFQDSGTKSDLTCAYFISDKKGWVAGSGNTILATDDGGISWAAQQPGGNSKQIFRSMYFTNERMGWIVDNLGGIIHTKDGGATWQPQASGFKWALTSVWFLNSTEGWAIGINQILLHTIDGGEHWTAQRADIDSPRSVLFNKIFFLDNQSGWITTNTFTSSQMGEDSPILHTQNGGKIWVTKCLIPDICLSAIRFVDRKHGWLAGMKNIYYTSDGGSTWKAQLQSSGDPVVDIFFIDDSHGWALTFTGNIYKYQIH